MLAGGYADNMANGYEYDVFVSYSNSDDVRDWVLNHFYPNFCPAFRQALGGRKEKVFIDRTEIRFAQGRARTVSCLPVEGNTLYFP